MATENNATTNLIGNQLSNAFHSNNIGNAFCLNSFVGHGLTMGGMTVATGSTTDPISKVANRIVAINNGNEVCIQAAGFNNATVPANVWTTMFTFTTELTNGNNFMLRSLRPHPGIIGPANANTGGVGQTGSPGTYLLNEWIGGAAYASTNGTNKPIGTASGTGVTGLCRILQTAADTYAVQVLFGAAGTDATSDTDADICCFIRYPAAPIDMANTTV